MSLKLILRIIGVCFAVTAITIVSVKIYTNVDLLSMPSEEIKYLSHDPLSMYIKNGQNKSIIEKIVYSFKAPWFWELTIFSFFYYFIPMVFASSMLLYWEKKDQSKT